jgi:alpha-tubulin suppressor-like RCC1 family protein
VLSAAAPARAEPPSVQVTAAYGDTCVRRSDATAWCWGFNGLDSLGDGTTNNSSSPVAAINVGTGVAEISAGQYHTCARKTDGTVWCWGYDSDGEIGNGTSNSWSAPVQVPTLSNVVQISTGYYHTCARKSDGTIWCWGAGSSGELGDGSGTTQWIPIQVAGLTNAVDVSCGFDHSCARKSDGTAWCWGANDWGQLGDGTQNGHATPEQVTALGSTVAEISANNQYTCARKTDGTVWCWGNNTDAVIGDGTSNDRLLPVQVPGLPRGAVQISAGDNSTCAILGDSTLWCWGSNFDGDIGDGTTNLRSTPEQVTAIYPVAEVSVGVHTCARKFDGTVWCWGHNSSGELGNGSTTPSYTPVQVPIPTAATVTPVPAGDWRAVALLAGAILASQLRRRDGRRLLFAGMGGGLRNS